MIIKYQEYLKFLDKTLKKFFEAQKPFIKCKKGCAYCCKEGEYPLSELEYIYMMLCFNETDNETKDIVLGNIETLLSTKRKKLYPCPFLVNNECSVYPARPIICRTFGLISYNDKGKNKVPFCIDLGLNYSDVYDNETALIKSDEGSEFKPLAYNIGREYLRSKKYEKEFDIFFGDDKALIDRLREEF